MIELLSQAAPWAGLKRDVKFGMTPLHWLLVRFVDTRFEHFGEHGFQIVDDDVDDVSRLWMTMLMMLVMTTMK